MADPGGGNHGTSGIIREHRKGNWTFNETMVLIEAKKMDDERRLRRSIGLPEQPDSRNKPAELRWKWIEDYCWRKGCMRSQNQCNDKWDNLMRDYKKVREYERRRLESSLDAEASSSSSAAAAAAAPSYWKMEKSERKEINLPSNMVPQIYEALVEVVEKKSSSSSAGAAGGSGGQVQRVQQSLGFVHQPAPLMAQPKHQIPAVPSVLPLPPPPPPPQPTALSLPPAPLPPPPYFHAQPILPTTGSSSDSDTSEYSDTSPAKRRRRTSGRAAEAADAEAAGTSGAAGVAGGTSGSESSEAVGAAIWRSASVIADAIRASEERQDKRHRDLVSLQERRLKMEESKAEMNRQGMNGLVDAINKLANSIFALASSHHNNNQNLQSQEVHHEY